MGNMPDNIFSKINIPIRDVKILAASLALAAKLSEFKASHVVKVAKSLGDLRSESTLNTKAREVLKALVDNNILSVREEGEGRIKRKYYSAAVSMEELKEQMPKYIRRFFEMAIDKLDKGEIKLEEERKGGRRKRRKTKVEGLVTLDKFL